MAQAKRKTTTRTAKKTTARAAKSRTAKKACAKKCITNADRMHIYIVTAMSMIAVILLGAEVAMLMVK
jgi:hypothetical protein